MIHFPTIRYVPVTSPLFAYETLKPNYSQAFFSIKHFKSVLIRRSTVYWIWISRRHLFANDCTGVHSRLSADIQYYCRLVRLLSRMGWFWHRLTCFACSLLRKNEGFLEVLHVYCCVSSIPVRTHLKFVLLGLQDWLQLQKRWHLQETRREGV